MSEIVAWDKKVPWWIEEAVEQVERFLSPDSKVFEWGSGGSTIWLARRVGHLVSIEHHTGWYNRVRAVLEEEALDNVDLKLFTGPPYYAAIRQYPDNFFDFISIDGRQRVDCVREAIHKVRPGGMLLFDDSQRDRYQSGITLLAGWLREDYLQQIPQQTTIFIRE